MGNLFLKRKDFKAFVKGLLKSYKVYAPVRKGSIHGAIHVFSEIEAPEDMDLDMVNTDYPAKKLFMPDTDVLFSYEGGKIDPPVFDDEKRAIVGIRPCDVNALKRTDKIFLEQGSEDPYYAHRRENTLIIAIACTETGENCFCTSMGADHLDWGFDLLLTEVDDGYIVSAGSEQGELLASGKLFGSTDKMAPPGLANKKRLSSGDIARVEKSFDSPVWKEEAEDCLSCAACNMVCPTCLCFAVHDVPSLDLQRGVRVRNWTPCQIRRFTKVAGGHIFRDRRAGCFKHRLMHKFTYFNERFGEHMCVGCGRCVSSCPKEIDITKVIRKLR